jgi:D-cysteine desulfhydrase
MPPPTARPQLHILEPFTPPPWTAAWSRPPPARRYVLGALPTPIHRWTGLPGIPPSVDLWIKRDDLSGSTLSGNKVRKLEFLFADALGSGADTVVTVGGLQSNHARATAAAAAEAGLACHLILRAPAAVADSSADPGLVGNLLVDRLTGAHIHFVTKAEYARHGGPALTARLAEELAKNGARPYTIPVGGSNGVGAWGYVCAVTELEAGVPGGGGEGSSSHTPWDDVVVTCGSGGTVAGLAAGIAAARLPARLHAYGVCDDPAYFEAFVRDEHLIPMGVPDAARIAAGVRYVQAKGAGYAIPRPAELDTVAAVARTTGVVTDATYTGKALHAFLSDVAADPGAWAGRHVLFIHTGGLLSLYDQAGELEGRVAGLGRVHRMRGL